jgi:tetratricopeptide (TPR) repeat protein
MVPRPLLYSLLASTLPALACCSQVSQTDRPLHEAATAAAWEAFKKGQYEDAIKHADHCIEEFRGDANRRQKALADQKERIPLGHVSAEQKAGIIKNGTLNDVATCYYLKGRSADKLGQKDLAAKALTSAESYPAARAWDPRGWFWSPAEASARYRTNPKRVEETPHEVYTADSWEEYNRGEYKNASAHADRCIAEFHQAALEMEKDLAKRNVLLPTGPVDEATKNTIFANGLLNDVATCLFIKGKSAEGVGDRKSAIEAYQNAIKLGHGRCWDPRGWFWSPAEKSSDRLDVLR